MSKDGSNERERAEGALQASPARSIEIEPPEVRQQRRNDYNRLVRTAKLVSLLMEKVDFRVSPESLGVNKKLLTRDLSAKVEILAVGSDDGTCIADVTWSIKFNFKKKNIVRCSASYLVTYEGMKDFSEEVIGIFVDTNAKGAVYSYFRAIYAHLDWSANLGSPPLPIVQLQAKV